MRKDFDKAASSWSRVERMHRGVQLWHLSTASFEILFANDLESFLRCFSPIELSTSRKIPGDSYWEREKTLLLRHLEFVLDRVVADMDDLEPGMYIPGKGNHSVDWRNRNLLVFKLLVQFGVNTDQDQQIAYSSRGEFKCQAKDCLAAGGDMSPLYESLWTYFIYEE